MFLDASYGHSVQGDAFSELDIDLPTTNITKNKMVTRDTR